MSHKNHDEPTTPVATAIAATRAPDITAALVELDRLRRENEILKSKLATVINLPNERGALQVYRVSLQGVNPQKSSRLISPKESAPPAMQQVQEKSYDDLDLFFHEAEHDPGKLDSAAWRRFCADSVNTVQESGADGTVRSRPIDHIRDRRSFWISAVQGKRVDFLPIPAHSPADAFALFCRFCGIVRTSVQPTVEVMALDPNTDGSVDLHYLSA